MAPRLVAMKSKTKNQYASQTVATNERHESLEMRTRALIANSRGRGAFKIPGCATIHLDHRRNQNFAAARARSGSPTQSNPFRRAILSQAFIYRLCAILAKGRRRVAS